MRTEQVELVIYLIYRDACNQMHYSCLSDVIGQLFKQFCTIHICNCLYMYLLQTGIVQFCSSDVYSNTVLFGSAQCFLVTACWIYPSAKCPKCLNDGNNC